ncbi:MerR family transcriptional regulator [Luxibacter massiliensis]|uniref:MerR family transcriptional regulator n=1 Tax=Luxibacter massiliensis TaxID=2219695 RepID=UPI000F06B129|nr:MerR family transcriptional regulator [Luxibacter massiliensis]
MEYTITKLAKLACISSRTLRYYDEIGLLKPLNINSSGYRIYGEKELKRLQQILFLRQFGLELTAISQILNSDGFNMIEMLKSHLLLLEQQKREIDTIIENIHKTIENETNNIPIQDYERFIGLQKRFREGDFSKYQNELVRLYSAQQLDTYKTKTSSMTFYEISEINALERYIKYNLEKMMKNKTGVPSLLAHDTFIRHKEWLSYMLSPLTPEIYLSIAEKYVADTRFKEYYDIHTNGCAQLLFDIITYYVKESIYN